MLGRRLQEANKIAKKRLKILYWWINFRPLQHFRKQRNFNSGTKGKMSGRHKNKIRKKRMNKESGKTKRDYFYLQDALR